MNEIERICTRLIASVPVHRDEISELDHAQMRADVEARLRLCGLFLATSAYSEYYGLRLLKEFADPTVLDTPTNLGLNSDACALLTVLWARLALQRRTAEDNGETPADQPALLPQVRVERARTFTPSVRFETLVQEFGSRLGGRTRLHSILGQLRKLRFVNYNHLDDIQAGPLLELGIDGERMIDFIRSRVISELLSRDLSRSIDHEQRQEAKELSGNNTLDRDEQTEPPVDHPSSKRAAGAS